MAHARDAAKAKGEKFDETAFRARFNEQVPLGFIERDRGVLRVGRYGRWLRKHDTLATIDGVAFLHGGLTPEVAALGCEAINDTVRREIGADVDEDARGPRSTLAAGENGPLWYRGLARGDEPELAPIARRRPPRPRHARGRDRPHRHRHRAASWCGFDGKVVMIDAGMTDQYGGHAAALEIDGSGPHDGDLPDRREPLQLRRPRASSAPPARRRCFPLQAACRAA